MEQNMTPSPQPSARLVPFEFRGNAMDYFGIWFANALLNMVTLGFYSPWAKVRNLRYLYGNTYLENGNFDFHANPVDILKGRLIAVGVFTLYTIAASVSPEFEGVFLLIIIPLIPWVIVRSMKFRHQNTSYRNVRFGFTGSYAGAALEYLLFPVLAAFTLGLLLPYVRFRQKRYLINNTRFGTTHFRFTGEALAWYKVTGVSFVIMIASGLIVGGTIAAVTAVGESATLAVWLLATLGITVGMFLFLVAWDYYIAHTRNLIFNNGQISKHSFDSNLRTLPLFWLSLVNAIAIMVSFGFLSPWAKVRLMRLNAGTLNLVSAGDLDTFMADQQQGQETALGDELGDAFDVDFGL